MKPIVVVCEQYVENFEKVCNKLANQGYIMQACYIGYFNPNIIGGFTPEAMFMAVFALPQYAAQQSVHPTAAGGSDSDENSESGGG